MTSKKAKAPQKKAGTKPTVCIRIVPLEPVLVNAKRSKKSAAKEPIVRVRIVPLEAVLARAEPLK
jgi:hypothetical protein